MEAACTAVLLAFALCTALTVPRASAAPLTIGRVSPSNDLLGRQMAVAPSAAPDRPWGDPQRLAFCGPDGIQRTLDGDQSWLRVPTDGVAALAAGTDLPLAPRPGQAPRCQSVVLDPGAPDALYAVFEAVKAPQDAPPPWFPAGYYTRDGGQSWQAVPAPPAASALADGAAGAADATPAVATDDLQFRGFVADEAGVQALFARPPTGPAADVVPPAVMLTTDGGQSWQPAPFGCPASGACIRWGEPPTQIGSCNMHGYPQPLLVSDDGGQHWKAPQGARVANACFPNELIAVSDREVLLLAPAADELEPISAPIRVSHDGGLTFAPPPLPDGPDVSDLFELHLLPGDRVVARVSGPTPGPGWTWQLLWHDDQPPAQDRWCTLGSSVALPTSGAPLRVSGDTVWWIEEGGQPASVAAADLRC